MSRPTVSVIIPSYNAGPWLAATLESVLAQTWPALEIIVVDDGSTDDSRRVAQGFTGRGVRLVEQPNRGASAARNHGLQHAHGDFIQFLDADDLLAPDKLERQVQALSAAGDEIAAGPWGRFTDSPAAAVFVPEDNWRDSDPVDWLVLNFAGRGMMPPAAWLAPRSLIAAAGPWNERLTLNDDGEYFCRVLLAARRVRFCAEARSFYRSNLPGSLSRQASVSAWESAYLSQDLCVQHLLARTDNAVTRRAGADLFQRLAFAAYPTAPEVVRRAEEKVAALGGSEQKPGGGSAFQMISGLFGWKAARRLQSWNQR
jgi:glycosyltransferase involved in cell wall biosynthesis